MKIPDGAKIEKVVEYKYPDETLKYVYFCFPRGTMQIKSYPKPNYLFS